MSLSSRIPYKFFKTMCVKRSSRVLQNRWISCCSVKTFPAPASSRFSSASKLALPRPRRLLDASASMSSGLTCDMHTHFSTSNAMNKNKITVYFEKADGTRLEAKANVGDNLLDVVVENETDLDGFGACEGTLACSTCHLVLSEKDFSGLNEEPTDEEMDMLDLAYGLCDTSRLGCQVFLTKEHDGLVVKVPEGLSDARG